ncbi:MAG: hypothetical protein A3I78_10135 [Gammaproteobacteria bacterium RIFCSPLOWO2_02_FULL_56_15]|nr:MAG: hypothetical protein A3I78_10135 [Gammaproteobacteria bacterium RIFCSPLOWO2_02_FULL_56_15]
MYTDCPACHRQFHIKAAQISTAGGQVICGFCGRQFDAIPRLRDHPSAIAATDPVPSLRSGAVAPQIHIQDPKTGADAPSNRDDFPEPEFEIPGILQNDPPRRRSAISRLLWTAGVILLVMVVVGQLAWFNRDLVLTRYPELVPRLRELCERLECSVYRKRDIDAIRLLNRDVRDHPRYENALLVNATMSNESGQIQPFPGIRLLLFNTNGRQVAYRDFHPDEYLDESFDIDAGMAPQKPVHFVLEVTGATALAVSFEFAFF